MSNAWSQPRIKIHRQGRIVLALEIIGNEDAHVGHILHLCREPNAGIKSVPTRTLFLGMSAVSEGNEAQIQLI